MLTNEFDYALPQELIAQKPLPRRDQSRMMVLDRRTADIIHSRFSEFPSYLKKGDVLVINKTKVIPARVWGKKGEHDIEFLFLNRGDRGTWDVLCRPAKKVRLGDIISFSPGFEGKVIGVEEEGKRILQFPIKDVLQQLKKIGYAPLPPYIKRKKKNGSLRQLDLTRYQTVFAGRGKAIAAPTAGLHFTPKILERIEEKEVRIIPISLQVGLATFQPVRTSLVNNHQMLEETYSISKKAAAAINAAKDESRPIIGVGTTSVRALESAFKHGRISSGKASTRLFIYPGYDFKAVDRFLTNFHLPRSSLLMMVAAFTGLDFIKRAYQIAIQKKYRFYSYGDCMLIL
jgi:S-adenosylmethionine:tRNA ribosyltransferase-isomerase